MAIKHVVPANWGPIIPSSDGKYYSAYPDGDAPIAGTLTLTGFFGAGAKPVIGPVFHDLYDSAPTGSALKSIGYSQVGSLDPVVSEDRAYTGKKAAKLSYPVKGGFPRTYKALPAPVRSLYIAAHIYWDFVADPGDAGVFKLVRGGALPIYTGSPAFYDTIRSRSGDGQISGTDNGIRDWSGAYRTGGNSVSEKEPYAGAWHFVEYLWDLGTPGGSDARFCRWINGLQTDNLGGVQALESGSNKLIDYVMTFFDGIDGTNDVALDLWQDYFYVDEGGARVVMTDNADYASSTKFAIQTLNSWSDTSIDITTNHANFAAGDTVHYHIFDITGTHVAAVEGVI